MTHDARTPATGETTNPGGEGGHAAAPAAGATAPAIPASSARPAYAEVNPLDLVNVLLERWRLVLGLPLAAGLVTAAIVLVIPPTFTASTAFVPEVASQGRLPPGLAGLAGQFGVSLGAAASQSPQFYTTVARSQEIVNRVLLTRYADPRSPHNPPDSTTLLRILKVEGDSLADSLHNGRKALRGLVSMSIDHPTKIVTLSVTSRYPHLAAAVANRFAECLDEFNATTRQSQARELRRFTEARLSDAEAALQLSEEAMRRFYERNRQWQQAPQLAFEHERLQRQIRITEEVTLTLRREYENARIAEVNDTPVITLIYAATTPREKSGPKRRKLVVLATLLGGTLAVFVAFAMEYAHRVRQGNEGQYLVLRGLVAQFRHDVRQVFRRRRH